MTKADSIDPFGHDALGVAEMFYPHSVSTFRSLPIYPVCFNMISVKSLSFIVIPGLVMLSGAHTHTHTHTHTRSLPLVSYQKSLFSQHFDLHTFALLLRLLVMDILCVCRYSTNVYYYPCPWYPRSSYRRLDLHSLR